MDGPQQSDRGTRPAGKAAGRATFGKRFKLFTLLGFPVYIDPSWFLIAFLITWSLASVFPTYLETDEALKGEAPMHIARSTYWLMGLGGALGLFACILLHELGHALVARRYGVPVKGITLFLFGGVSEMAEEPKAAKSEFLVAIAGGVVSLILAGVLFAVGRVSLPETVGAVIGWLAVINVILAGFNLVPAFPLDGGRVLRAALWQWKGSLRWATSIAARIGAGFGAALMVFAAVNLLVGNFVGAMWFFLIGMFLRNAAKSSYQQVLWRQILQGLSVRRLMNVEPRTVAPNVTVDRFVDEYVYRYHHKMFPVTDDGHLIGCVSTDEIRDIPRGEWSARTVGELAHACSEQNTINADADATVALRRMGQGGRSKLMAVDGDRLVGILVLRDLMEYINRRTELEGEGEPTD